MIESVNEPLLNRETLSLKYDQLLEKLLGRYQYFVCFFVICSMVGFGYIENGMAYLIMVPDQYQCKVNKTWRECSREQICEANLEYKATGPFSIQNWVQQYGILCLSDSEIGLLGSMIYLGQTLSAIPFSWLADYFGRRWTLSLAALVQVAALLVCYSTTNFQLAVWMMLLCGVVGTIASSTVAFVYMCEFIPVRLHNLIN